MGDTCCRSCDGRKTRVVKDRENVFSERTVTCGACNGTGKKPGPPKGDRKFFRRAAKSVDDDNDLNRAADTFLARHGYGKGGR